MQHDHNVITFKGSNPQEICSVCTRLRFLGVCSDGCNICQSCYHKEHGLADLPSDSMYPKRSVLWPHMVAIIEKNFPKGDCAERGAALVALAEIEMLLQGCDIQSKPNAS